LILRAVNELLSRTFNLRIDLRAAGRPWDRHFRGWIEEAKKKGADPNDIADQAWRSDGLDQLYDHWYMPNIKPDRTVLELGPGTGRLTRRVIGRVKHLYVADNSRLVCDWMRQYLAGKGEFTVVDLESGDLDQIDNGSVDAVLAHGVFEHFSLHEIYDFLIRVSGLLVPDGVIVFSYDVLSTSGGKEWFVETFESYGKKSPFHFYTPETLTIVAEMAGYQAQTAPLGDGRIAAMQLRWIGVNPTASVLARK